MALSTEIAMSFFGILIANALSLGLTANSTLG